MEGNSMLKRMLFAVVATALVAAFALPTQTVPAASATVTCKAAAKAKFPKDLKARHAYRKSCRAAWKASH
jgi:hypothetical protein